MLRIFVSHAWSEDATYARFVGTLGRLLSSRWSNVSIPRDAAIDIFRAEAARMESGETKRLKEQIWRLHAELRDPSIPDVAERWIWRDGKLQQVRSRGNVLADIVNLKARLAEIDTSEEEEMYLVNPPKDVGRVVRQSPALSAAIRERLEETDLAFLLITDAVRLHLWVDHEIKLCAVLRVPLIGVRVDSVGVSPDFRVDCTEIVDWEDSQISEAVEQCERFLNRS